MSHDNMQACLVVLLKYYIEILLFFVLLNWVFIMVYCKSGFIHKGVIFDFFYDSILSRIHKSL